LKTGNQALVLSPFGKGGLRGIFKPTPKSRLFRLLTAILTRARLLGSKFPVNFDEVAEKSLVF
jgi:hypothetical protein